MILGAGLNCVADTTIRGDEIGIAHTCHSARLSPQNGCASKGRYAAARDYKESGLVRQGARYEGCHRLGNE